MELLNQLKAGNVPVNKLLRTKEARAILSGMPKIAVKRGFTFYLHDKPLTPRQAAQVVFICKTLNHKINYSLMNFEPTNAGR